MATDVMGRPRPGLDAKVILDQYFYFAMAVFIALAVAWRRNREFHRRLMLLATIALTGAAFARFPLPMMQNTWFWYSFTDGLLVICVLRELLLTRRVHPVFLYGVPLFLIGEYGA